MSAKDAPGEVKDNNIFDSPNISSSVDDIEEIGQRINSIGEH